jgi:DNA-binding SARP family transcriptional activator
LAPGAVVSTSTKPDVLRDTVQMRRWFGTCYVFDPTGSTSVPEGSEELRWSPLVGSEIPDGAVEMARTLVQAARPQAATHPEAQHWLDRAEALLAPLFFGAAAGGRTIADVCRWVLSHDVREPEAILSALGAQTAKVSLSSVWRTEERERSGIFSTAAGLLSVYRTQAALEPATRPNFDPHRFAASQDTLYICAPGHTQELLAPLVVALLDQIRAACYLRRRSHPDSAPALFLLDEVANIAPIPGLPQLASEGGSQGVVTVACLQDLSQARARWGTLADGFFSLFGTKVIFPGIADRSTLELVSSLMGEVQVPVQSVSRPVRPPAGLVFLDAILNEGRATPPSQPTVTTSTVFRRRMPVEAIYHGEPGRVFAFNSSGGDYLPTEGWWNLTGDFAYLLESRGLGEDRADRAEWPDSNWATPGPRVVGRDRYGGMVVVPGTLLETPAVPAPQIAIELQPEPKEPDVIAEHDLADQEIAAESPIRTATVTKRAVPDEWTKQGYHVLVRVMGPPELLGAMEMPERDKAVELACILALHRHRSMTSEELRAALWPGKLGEPGVAAKSMINTASLLRKAIGVDHFPEARRGSGYELGEDVGCDWTIFCEEVESAEGDLEKEILRGALSLIRGAPFEGIKSGTYTWAWTEHFVSMIERGIRTATYRFCELALDGGDHESAVWAALQALAVDPYDRGLWGLYLRASASFGNRTLEQAWKEAKGILREDASELGSLLESLRRDVSIR